MAGGRLTPVKRNLPIWRRRWAVWFLDEERIMDPFPTRGWTRRGCKKMALRRARWDRSERGERA